MYFAGLGRRACSMKCSKALASIKTTLPLIYLFVDLLVVHIPGLLSRRNGVHPSRHKTCKMIEMVLRRWGELCDLFFFRSIQSPRRGLLFRGFLFRCFSALIYFLA